MSHQRGGIVVGAGELREKAGDKVAHEALERCQFRLGQAAASCGARLMQSTADKVMVLAASPDAAADAASAMHLAMEKLPKTAEIKLSVGIGFHFGPVVQKGDEVFGDTVNLAARQTSSHNAVSSERPRIWVLSSLRSQAR